MSQFIRLANAVKPALVFLVVVLLWGSTFIAVKICLQEWSVVQVMAGRYIFGALLLLPLAVKAYCASSVPLKANALPILHLALVGSVLRVG